ncbi:MAG: SsrA-binding protein SmpB [bacterium]|jgi:SsrA-binding protein|nr:SsrA-binding protein SmpB [Bacillota bacterium]
MKKAAADRTKEGAVINNRKARHEYNIIETMEAGIALQGSEVKSLRQGMANLRDSYARVDKGEVILYNMHISPYDKASHFNHEPKRPRKLLLHKREINRLMGAVREKGFTLVPLKVYFNRRGLAKVELALARGKQKYDKREAIARRDAQREMARAVKERYG